LRKAQRRETGFRTDKKFREWVTEGYSVRQLADQSKKPKGHVRRDIRARLGAFRAMRVDEVFPGVSRLMVDGYALPGGKILIAYYEYVLEKLVWFEIADRENKETALAGLLTLRDSFGYDVRSFTVDGGAGILAAVREAYPAAAVQRCLVHVQRQARTYLTDSPKSPAGKALRKIVRYESLTDAWLFPRLLRAWETRYVAFLGEKTVFPSGRWRYRHGNVRKAANHVRNALPCMYQAEAAGDPLIERSTNKLEGWFGTFTDEGVLEHKGLSPERLPAFVAAWAYFRNHK